MAIQLNAGDIVRATVKFSHPVASLIENVYHFYAQGTGTALIDDLADVVSGCLDDVYAAFDAHLSLDTSFVECGLDLLIWVVDKWLTVGSVAAAVDLPSFAPLAEDDVLPPSNAALVRFLTDVPKREGKKYFAPFCEPGNDEDARVSSAITAELITAGTILYTFDEPIPDSNISLLHCILSPTEEIFTFPTALVLPARWGVQRRRKEFAGE